MRGREGTGTLRGGMTALIVVVMVGAMVVPALAGHDTGTSYTGCLDAGPKKGNLYRLAEGDAPVYPCNSGDPTVHFGSGDITAVIAGEGLEGGGDAGPVSLSLAGGYQLPQLCANGQVAKWSGSEWSCADDDDTTYSAGTALDLTGTTFGLEPGYRLPQSCDPGELTAWDGSQWSCLVAPTATGVVATLDAGTVIATGSSDDDLCDEGQNEGGDAGPHTSSSGTVHLAPGDYMVVHVGLFWEVSKSVASAWDDPDVFYGGHVSAGCGTTPERGER